MITKKYLEDLGFPLELVDSDILILDNKKLICVQILNSGDIIKDKFLAWAICEACKKLYEESP